MPRNGYWIECVPLMGDQQKMAGAGLYSASVSSFPEVTETAPSPDQAIEKLRDRLRNIRQQYAASGNALPEMDNPVRPPTRLRAIQGWISVYINVGESKEACAVCLHSLSAWSSPVTALLLAAV